MQDLLTSTNENLLEKNSEDSDDSEPNFDDVDFKEIEEIMNSNSCVDDADDTCTHNLTFGSIEQEQAFWYEIEEAYCQSNNENNCCSKINCLEFSLLAFENFFLKN